MTDGFKQIVRTVQPSTRELAHKARELIYSIYPDSVEVAWPKQKVVGYGVGEKKMSEHFVYLSISKEHINIGFYYGAELPDPQHLLKGEGKLLKHVRIEKVAELNNLALRSLIESACRYLPRLAPDDSRIPV